MHQAVCDKCRKECEVPFRPTSGKPVYCSNCFESNRNSDSRPTTFEERRMFEAVCNECNNTCRVPFLPTGEKPVYCSNCFGEKKGAGARNNECSQPQCKEQFEVLNNKLDRILAFLTPNAVDLVAETTVSEEVSKPQPKKSKAKKTPSKKK